MTPTDRLHEIVPAATRVVDRMWIGQFDSLVPSGNGTVKEVLDAMFVTAATASARLRRLSVDGITAPFTYGWVPMTEFADVMAELLAAAQRAGSDDRADLEQAVDALAAQAADLAEATRATQADAA